MLRLAVLPILLLALLLQAAAVEVRHRPLEEILKPDSLVLEGTLRRVESRRGDLWESLSYAVSEPVFLQGPEEPVEAIEIALPLPHRRAVDRQTVTVGVVRDASGIERDLVPGERYLFLGRPAEKGIEFFRAEPVDRKSEILRRLLSLQDPPREVRLRGLAANAKAGALLDSPGLAVYIDGMDAWQQPPGVPVLVTGKLSWEKRIPDPVGPNGEISTGAWGLQAVLREPSIQYLTEP
ncbi:MAG: hypothetical protein HY319_23990 [Armatimonadetes bacterium]|nr:hypothetical protein [Armatimonadota bacterium]